jgi:hypothetical protein
MAGGRARSKWPLYAGIAGVGAAVAIVIAIFASSSSSTAKPTPTASPEPQITGVHKPEQHGGGPTITPADDLTVTRQVALAVEPLDAHVYRNQKDLGTSPVVVDVEEGKVAEIEIRREGYKSRIIKLDGTTPKASVKLERVPSGRVVPASRPQPSSKREPPKSKPKPAIGGGEIVNPWE